VLRLALLTEAGTDDVVAQTIVQFLSGRPTEIVTPLIAPARGWPAVRDQVPGFVKGAYYHTDADAIVVLVDSDLSTPHSAEHDTVGAVRGCRLCELRTMVRETLSGVSPVTGRAMPRTAVGVAVPAIEAWLLAGLDSRASEASWAQAQREARFFQIKRALKLAAYGAARVGEQVAIPRARHLILEALRKGDLLRQSFPAGFGAFADDILAW
jgi:hypothetical protein